MIAASRACALVALASLGIAQTASAHGPLVTGDVVIVGVDTVLGGESRIVLLALRDLHDGDTIELTDRGRTSSGSLRPGEGADFYEVVRFTIPRGTFLEVRSRAISAELPADQILAYRGSFTGDVLDGDWLDALTYGGPWSTEATSDATSTVPPPLAPRALALPSAEAMAFVGSADGTAAEVLARVHDIRNWRTGPHGSFSFPARADVRGGPGDACAADVECGSGFCVDSVCCNNACNRDALLRCEWCDFGVTSPSTGICGVAPRSIVCRFARTGCDAPETCDGVTAVCPEDGLQPPGYVCRRVRGECDVADVCDGVSTECPSDALQPSGTVCRASVDLACDAEERCDGLDFACGADIPTREGETCSTACGGAGMCSGVLCAAPECPIDAGASDAGRPDAGPRDAGRRDAARRDGGVEVEDGFILSLDAGAGGDVDIAPPGTCACAAGRRSDGPVLVLALLGLAAWRRYKRGLFREE